MLPARKNQYNHPRQILVRQTTALLCGLLWLGSGAVPIAHGQSPSLQEAALGWQPLGGPTGRVSHLVAQPGSTTLYAVAIASTHRQSDQTQWQKDGTLVQSSALYRSPNGGATWQPVTNNLVPGPITALYVDPKTGVVYASVQGAESGSTRQHGVWSSEDQGAHWQQVRLGRDDLTVWRITQDAGGSYLLLGTTEAVSQAGGETQSPASYVFRSKDAGENWQSFRIPFEEHGPEDSLVDLIPHPENPNRLFVTTKHGALWESNDVGETWNLLMPRGSPQLSASQAKSQLDGATPAQEQQPETSASPVYLAIGPGRPDVMLAVRREIDPAKTSTDPNRAAGSALVTRHSADGGKTWAVLPATGLPAESDPRTLVSLTEGVFLLNTNLGSYRSTDTGSTWQLLEGPLSSGDIGAFVPLAVPHSPTAVLAATGYGIFVSRDAGAIWQQFGSGLPHSSSVSGLLTDARRPELIFLINNAAHEGGENPSSPGVDLEPPMLLRSLDGGRTWATASQGLPDVAPMAWVLDPNDPNTLFISSQAHLFRSTDAGLNWQTMQLKASGHYAIAVAPSDSNVLYLGGIPALRSGDRGLTWQELPSVNPGTPGKVTGLAIDPADAAHVWAAVEDSGVYESENAGQSWQPIGLSGKPLRWLIAAPGASGSPDQFFLYAGVWENGIYRWDSQTHGWTAASDGLPAQSTILAFLPDPRQRGTLWASRDGGGIYRSTDFGTHWSNVSDTTVSSAASQKGSELGVGDNLTLALTIDQTTPSSVLLGTASAGVWALRAGARPSPTPRAVDARIEIVWPHDNAPASEAQLANIGLRLFVPNSLLQTPCGWRPEVTVWQALDNNPAEPLEKAEQRSVQGHPFPYWELNDVDVSLVNDPQHKLYYMIKVLGTNTATSIWAHSADARTFYPYPEVPSGVAVGNIDAVDARILIVWPHDEAGVGRSASDATYANISVALFKHGTRLSVPVGWQPQGLTLYGAWNQEIGRPLAQEAEVRVRTAGAITYPTWEFNNIPIAEAADPANKLHLWIMVDGIDTYPTIWTHGTEARTFFPAQDEPVQGCVP